MAVGLGMSAGTQIMLVEVGDQLLGFLAADHAHDRVELGLGAVVILLRRRRADVEEVGQADDLPQKLQELRLPILERVAAGDDQIL